MKCSVLSKDFFREIVHPLFIENFPEVNQVMSCGMFGNGSEVTCLDDELSQDHDWGPRVQVLLPKDVYNQKGE